MAPAILALLQFAPKIIGLFGDDDSKAAKIGDTIAGIAQSVTGSKSVDESAAKLISNPQLAHDFESAVMKSKTVIERLDEQSRHRASEQYKTSHKMADKIAWRIMVWNLPIIAVMAVVNLLAAYFMSNLGALLAVVSNLIGVVIGALITERQQVTSFHFGSSLGSKAKDGLKANLR
jgi:hypothetical protein